MKSKNKSIKVIGCIVLGIILVFSIIFVAVYQKCKAWDLALDINSAGWEKYISYDMLSEDLQKVISEEEFSDTNPENRFRMYQKLENLIVDTRPLKEFDGSTSGYNTPYCEFYETDGKKYIVNFRIDIDSRFSKIKVRNFCCDIQERIDILDS